MSWPPAFPRIPALLAEGDLAGDDLVVSAADRAAFFEGPVVVEEKLDGANVSLWRDDPGGIQVATRGGTGARDRAGQLGRLRGWIGSRSDELLHLLPNGTVLYGEWLWLTHGIFYDGLPDLFIGLDLWSEATGFLAADERDRQLDAASLVSPPRVFTGTLGGEARLRSLMGPSRFSDGSAEGLIVRVEAEGRLRARAKLLAPSFRRVSDEDWSGPRRENRVVAAALAAKPSS